MFNVWRGSACHLPVLLLLTRIFAGLGAHGAGLGLSSATACGGIVTKVRDPADQLGRFSATQPRAESVGRAPNWSS